MYAVELSDYIMNYTQSFNALFIFMAVVTVYKYCFGNSTPPPKLQKFLNISDEYSYDIYMVHMIYVKGILSLLDITNSYVINTLIMLVAVIISAIILHSVSYRLNSALMQRKLQKGLRRR